MYFLCIPVKFCVWSFLSLVALFNKVHEKTEIFTVGLFLNFIGQY
jgi:hypothetical protein